MGWTEALPSGRVRACWRENGRKRGKTFDYQYLADRHLRGMGEEPEPQPLAPVVPLRPEPAQGPTLAVLARHWLTRKEAGALKAATLQSYACTVRWLEADASKLGPIAVQALTETDLAAVVLHEGKPATQRARLKVLRQVLADARRQGLVPANVALDVAMPSAPTRKVRLMKPEHEEQMLKACETDEERAWLLLGLDAGLRWSEVAGLTADAIDTEEGLVLLSQVMDTAAGRLRDGTKNGHDDDLVPILTPRLAKALEGLKSSRQGLLLPSPDGGAWDYHNWRARLWKPLCKRAGIRPQPRFHDLRHSLGTRMGHGGMPTSQLKTLLRHRDERTTQRYVQAVDAKTLGALAREALQKSSPQALAKP